MTALSRSFAPAVRPAPTVLLVEDDPETRQFYLLLFAGDGFHIEQAHNGLQAFEKAIESAPDIIVTDIVVPGIDGIELCRRLRADARTKAIPVMCVTGYADRHYQDRASDAGADAVMMKPCGGDELLGEANRLLGRSTLDTASNG